MKIINLGLIVLITFTVACKTNNNSSNQAATKQPVVPVIPVTPSADAPVPQQSMAAPEETVSAEKSNSFKQEGTDNLKNNIYRLKVNFYSIGSGTENEMMLQLEDFVGTFSAEKKLNVDYEKSGWGKEGETDYCFRLKELDDSQQKEFIIKTKDLLKGAKWVHVYENEPCTHIKKP